MKPFLFIAFILTSIAGCHQYSSKVRWVADTFKSTRLDKKYAFAPFLKPSFLEADFNGDGIQDVAILVIEKSTKRKGILLVHGNTREPFLFGAGTSIGSGGKDFKWADKWALYKEKTASETQFDEETGDILGGKTVNLARPGVLVEAYEDGAAVSGGLIYFNGTKYIWIHQGE